MDSLLENGFASLHLNSAETTVTAISLPEVVEQGLHGIRVLGKVLMNREQDTRKIRATFTQSWGCGFSVERLQGNIFQFDFESTIDASRVLADGPWCFSNALVVLRRWELNWDKDEDFFSSMLFWIEVWGIPLQYCVEKVAGLVMKVLRGDGVCQLREEFGTGCRLFRFRAPVFVNKPICRYVPLTINGIPITGKLRYARLPNYCFSCGKFDHLVDRCPGVNRELSASERRSLPYNVHLKADRRTTLLREHFASNTGPYGASNSNVVANGLTQDSGSISPKQTMTPDSGSYLYLNPKPQLFTPEFLQRELGHFARSFATELGRIQASNVKDLFCSLNFINGMGSSNMGSSAVIEDDEPTISDVEQSVVMEELRARTNHEVEKAVTFPELQSKNMHEELPLVNGNMAVDTGRRHVRISSLKRLAREQRSVSVDLVDMWPGQKRKFPDDDDDDDVVACTSIVVQGSGKKRAVYGSGSGSLSAESAKQARQDL